MALEKKIEQIKKDNTMFSSNISKGDISKHLRREKIKLSRKCSACQKQKINHIFYHWQGIITEVYLGLICSKCAYREAFGNKYKINKRYIKWKEKNNDRTKR